MTSEQDRRGAHGRVHVDVVLEGGGVKAAGLVGALAVLEERGYRVVNRAGTSAGAIVAALHAAGYSADELHDLLIGLDFTRFTDRGLEDRIPLLGRPLSVLFDFGVYEGDELTAWLADKLAARGVHTFADLTVDDPDRVHEHGDELFDYSCHVIASDITDHRLLVLPRDAARLGTSPDELNVALAVRMSAGIPFFYEPVRYRGPDGDRPHLVVDGGVLSNFPVWLFDTDEPPRHPTFGLRLVDPAPTEDLGARLRAPRPGGLRLGVLEYLEDLVTTMVEAHDRRYIAQADFVRTIAIPTLGVATTDFDLNPEQAEALYQAGRQATEAFLDRWDFDAYVEAFRTGPAPGRGEATRRQLEAR